MIKTVLVCTDGSAHGEAATQYGIFFAKALPAALAGLHVLDSRMLEGPLMADISGWIGAQPYGAQLQQFRELLQSRGESVIGTFNAACESAGVRCESWIKMGHPARVILEEEARTELLIIGQKGEHADLGGDLMGSCADRIARNSVKPCLVVPATFQPVGRILAAYDGSGHASQGLHEAVELASALGVELLIACIAEHGHRQDYDQVAADGRKLAAAHGCQARTVVLDGVPAEVIGTIAAEESCDLIVVGAHGHGRIREMFIGSTTTQLIARSERPVLIVR
jgi:nucleotide-binding universal stress UspA family protein